MDWKKALEIIDAGISRVQADRQSHQLMIEALRVLKEAIEEEPE